MISINELEAKRAALKPTPPKIEASDEQPVPSSRRAIALVVAGVALAAPAAKSALASASSSSAARLSVMCTVGAGRARQRGGRSAPPTSYCMGAVLWPNFAEGVTTSETGTA